MASELDKLKGGEHDGIQEYDNDLPRWWLYLFYLTIVFAVIYVGYYHVINPQDNQEARIQAQMDRYNQQKAHYAAEHAPKELDAAALLAYVNDKNNAEKGRVIFTARCVPCHGASGEGIIGPNLTDKYWINGGTPSAIRNTITNGVLQKGMLAWKGVLSADDINNAVAFVWSLRGTTPPNPKAPQGDLVAE